MINLPSCFFNFQDFVEDLRNNPEKHEIVEKYEEHYGSLKDKKFTDLSLFTEYLSKFVFTEGFLEQVKVPDALVEEFNCPIGTLDYKTLLLIFVAASFSSEYTFVHCDETDQERLKITVHSGNRQITKYLDDLWSFQIKRLFDIYAEEQMNLAILMKDSKDEKKAIQEERETRLTAFKKKMAELVLEKELATKRLDLRNKLRELVEMN